VVPPPPQQPTQAERLRVAELLGRQPQGAYEIVATDDATGDPLVIRNHPVLDDGRPMPTRFWLLQSAVGTRISRLEAAGGVTRAEHELDPADIARTHAAYAVERDAAIPPTHAGPRPTGGVGGTRQGVKCLHAHYANHLAGGDDVVGRWVDEQLRTGAYDR
jgi:hypothetical protein